MGPVQSTVSSLPCSARRPGSDAREPMCRHTVDAARPRSADSAWTPESAARNGMPARDELPRLFCRLTPPCPLPECQQSRCAPRSPFASAPPAHRNTQESALEYSVRGRYLFPRRDVVLSQDRTKPRTYYLGKPSANLKTSKNLIAAYAPSKCNHAPSLRYNYLLRSEEH